MYIIFWKYFTRKKYHQFDYNNIIFVMKIIALNQNIIYLYSVTTKELQIPNTAEMPGWEMPSAVSLIGFEWIIIYFANY